LSQLEGRGVRGGPDLFTVLGQTITLNGLLFGLAMGLRVALMVTAAGVWMMTTSPQKLTVGLLHLGLPYKAGVAMTAAGRWTLTECTLRSRKPTCASR